MGRCEGQGWGRAAIVKEGAEADHIEAEGPETRGPSLGAVCHWSAMLRSREKLKDSGVRSLN